MNFVVTMTTLKASSWPHWPHSAPCLECNYFHPASKKLIILNEKYLHINVLPAYGSSQVHPQMYLHLWPQVGWWGMSQVTHEEGLWVWIVGFTYVYYP
jgi:hypothetical protein